MKRSMFVLLILLTCSACGQRPPTPTSVPTLTIMPTPTLIPVATATSTPAPTPTPSRTGIERLQTLLEYIPAEWIDNHPYAVLGPQIFFLDVARIRQDLELPPVTGADEWQSKLGLIAGLDTQAFGLGPVSMDNAKAFDEWGWDIADVDQLLVSYDGTAILLGSFGRTEIKERLADKGYKERRVGDYALFTAETDQPKFAFKSRDTLIVGQSESEIERLVQQKANSSRSLRQHPSMISFPRHLEGVWGVVLSPPGDPNAFSSYAENVLKVMHKKEFEDKFAEFYKLDQEPHYGWDVIAIAFRGSKTLPTSLTFLYHYPSSEEAQKDTNFVQRILTEMPSLQYSGQRTWGDLLDLEGVKVQGDILKAVASTNSKSLIGMSIGSRDFIGFLPVHFVPANPFPNWQDLSSSEGKFSILMPGASAPSTQTVNTAGGNVTLHQFFFVRQDSAYGVAYADYADSVVRLGPDAIFAGARDSAKQQGTLLGERNVSLGKYPGRELSLKSSDGRISLRARMFLVRNRFYQILVAGPGEEAFSKVADQFFDSFKLLEK